VCPLTGAPLAETDLKTLDELAHRIRTWILNKSIGASASSSEAAPAAASAVSSAPAAGNEAKKSAADSKDDLYDF
jgi:hypothetical protein